MNKAIRPMRAQPANTALILLATMSALLSGCADPKGQDAPANLDILQVLPASRNMEVGESTTLGAQHIAGTSATNVTAKVQWSSDNVKVLTVAFDAESGAVATAVGPGTAHVVATSPEGKATAEFVVRASAKTIELDKGILEIPVGIAKPLKGVVIATDATKRPVEGGEWGTFQPESATVDSDGVVTGVAPGAATISLTSGGLTTTQTVLVRDWKLESVSAEALNGTTLPFAQSTPIRVTGHFTGGHTQNLSTLFAFTSKDTPSAPASAQAAGEEPDPLLTFESAVATAGSAAGTSVVTGTGIAGSVAEGRTAELTFSIVNAELTALALDLPDHVSTKGEAVIPTIIGTYGGTLQFETAAELTANPESAAFIDQVNATITPLTAGNVSITASITYTPTSDKKAENEAELAPVTITTTKPLAIVDSDVTAVMLTAAPDATPTIATTETLALSARASFGPDTALDVTDPAVWTSDNEAVAVVSNVQAGRVTGLSAGTANISATYHGVSATFQVIVSR